MAEHLVNPDPARDAEDPFFMIYETDFVDGRITGQRIRPVPPSAIHADQPGAPAQDQANPIRQRDKIHPRLRELLLRDDRPERDELIIVFTEQPIIPRFPELILDEPRDSPKNRQALARAEALARSIQVQRQGQYDDLIRRLSEIAPGIRVRDRYWVINGLLVEAPLDLVEDIAGADFVLSVEPRLSGEQPPAGPRQIDDGRANIGSDPSFDRHLPAPPIALLDSGVRRTHTLLNRPGQLDRLRDCVDGGRDCNTGPNLDTEDVRNHGTATAAILIGNDSLTNDFRGVTEATLDSFRIYLPTGVLDQHAAELAFQRALPFLDKIVVAEIQGGHDDCSCLAVAAESAFDSGAVVVAANGNTPGPGTVCSPASARRVIGVGSFVVGTFGQDPGQSCGPTAGDNRVKPDIQGPTETHSAKNNTDTATGLFDGTSCAAPYVAGAAALIYGWFAHEGTTSDPGQVYAQLILAGNNTSDAGSFFPVNNTSGAGKLQLQNNGTALRGKVRLISNRTVDITVPVPNTGSVLAAAIWWPEYGLNPPVHNTITLTIIDPSGTARPEGAHATSVFQRVVTRSAVSGDWTVRIRGVNVPDAPHSVYWAVFITPPTVVRLARQARAAVSRHLRRVRDALPLPRLRRTGQRSPNM